MDDIFAFKFQDNFVNPVSVVCFYYLYVFEWAVAVSDGYWSDKPSACALESLLMVIDRYWSYLIVPAICLVICFGYSFLIYTRIIFLIVPAITTAFLSTWLPNFYQHDLHRIDLEVKLEYNNWSYIFLKGIIKVE